MTITDPAVVTAGGSDRHPIMVWSDEPGAAVEGSVLQITRAEPAAADANGVDDDVRVRVRLRPGARASVYGPAARGTDEPSGA